MGAPEGMQTITAVATDNLGASTVSAPLVVFVDGGGLPGVTISSVPDGEASEEGPGTATFVITRTNTSGDLPVALSTDCNPGSSMIESLPLIMNISACQLRLTPEEIVVACTANAAAAIALEDRAGAIAPGYDADLVVLDVPSLDEWFYTPGRPRVRQVLKRGQLVFGA